MSAVLPVSFAWTGTGRHGDDPVSTVSPAHTSPSPPPSESEPPLYLGFVGGWKSKRSCLDDVLYTVEPLNRGHFGTAAFVLSSEVVLFSEVV